MSRLKCGDTVVFLFLRVVSMRRLKANALLRRFVFSRSAACALALDTLFLSNRCLCSSIAVDVAVGVAVGVTGGVAVAGTVAVDFIHILRAGRRCFGTKVYCRLFFCFTSKKLPRLS